jgi:uncharacterized protein YndB with AHSA1/START domain
MKKKDPPVIVEQNLKSTIPQVWSALTDHRLMKKWYFDNIPNFHAKVGFETRFSIFNEDREFIHKWKVTEVIPLKLISYNWKYENYPGDSEVKFEIFNNGDLAKLRVTVLIYEDFPEDIPEFKRESCVGGWNYFIKDRLKNYLQGNL